MPQAIGSGAVKLYAKPHKNARLYQFEFRQVGTQEWTVVLHKNSRLLLTGLESFKEYEFRLAYRGTDPTVTYSDPLRSYVL